MCHLFIEASLKMNSISLLCHHMNKMQFSLYCLGKIPNQIQFQHVLPLLRILFFSFEGYIPQLIHSKMQRELYFNHSLVSSHNEFHLIQLLIYPLVRDEQHSKFLWLQLSLMLI